MLIKWPSNAEENVATAKVDCGVSDLHLNECKLERPTTVCASAAMSCGGILSEAMRI